MMYQHATPSPIHISIPHAMDDALRGTDQHPSQTRPASSMASRPTLTRQLMAFADGHSVNDDARALVEAMIVDYVDGLLDPSSARDLERAMRHSSVVARLVADKAEEIDLQNRLSLYYDDELDEVARAEVERLIGRDPHIAELAADMRRGGDLLQVALQPVPGQASIQPDVETLRRAFESPSDEADPIVRFSALILYATGASVDEKTQALLEKTIADYVDGALDHWTMQGLEASMRLSPSVARLVADRTCETRASLSAK